MIERRTPSGYTVIESPKGGDLYFNSRPFGLSEVIQEVRRDVATRVSSYFVKEDDLIRFKVEIAYGPTFTEFGSDDVAEWGVGMTEEEAWRFALGAHFGSYEDPVIT